MAEENVASSSRTRARIVTDVEEAPDDDVQISHLVEPPPVVSAVQSVDWAADELTPAHLEAP